MISTVVGAGRYRLGRTIARGGMAEIQLGLDTVTGHAVAVKRLHRSLSDDPQAHDLFRHEAEALAGLDHPGIVRLLDSGTLTVGPGEHDALEPATPCLVLELLPGESLSATIARQPVAPRRALAIIRQVLLALDHCHERGLVHGDVKPANVLLSPTGRAKLVDFGVAHALGEVAPVLGDGRQFLTPRYASPERLQRSASDQRSDLYAVGCLLQELLTGRPPFDGTPEQLLTRHLVDEPEAPSARRPGLPEALDPLVLRALAKLPRDRYAGAAMMIEELDEVERALSERPMTVPARTGDAVAPVAAAAPVENDPWAAWTPDESPVGPAFRRQRRRRRVLGRSVAGIAAAALLPVAGFGVLHLRGATTPGESAAALQLGGVVDAEAATRSPRPPAADSAGGALAVLRAPLAPAPVTGGPAAGQRTGGRVEASSPRPVEPMSVEPSSTGPTPDPTARSEPSAGRAPGRPAAYPTPAQPTPTQPTPNQSEPGRPATDPTPDQPTSEPKPDKPKPDKPKPDKPKPDKPKPDKPKPDKPKPDKPKPDKPKPDPKPDKPKPDPKPGKP